VSRLRKWVAGLGDEPDEDEEAPSEDEPGEPELTFLMCDEIRLERLERRDLAWSPSSEAQLERFALERWHRELRESTAR
jgi:hypothetical protein